MSFKTPRLSAGLQYLGIDVPGTDYYPSSRPYQNLPFGKYRDPQMQRMTGIVMTHQYGRIVNSLNQSPRQVSNTRTAKFQSVRKPRVQYLISGTSVTEGQLGRQ
jgi:hypothetical protein